MGEKSIEMLHQKELLPLTGYVHGGCSPVGMKKLFPTVFHSSVENLPTVIVSAGKIGYQVEVKPADLMGLVRAETADIIVENWLQIVLFWSNITCWIRFSSRARGRTTSRTLM